MFDYKEVLTETHVINFNLRKHCNLMRLFSISNLIDKALKDCKFDSIVGDIPNESGWADTFNVVVSENNDPYYISIHINNDYYFHLKDRKLTDNSGKELYSDYGIMMENSYKKAVKEFRKCFPEDIISKIVFTNNKNKFVIKFILNK